MDTSEIVPSEKHVLLIDDEPSILSALSTIFKNAGHQVATAENGEVALNVLEQRSFDLVFCDLKMPTMDGLTWLKEFQKHNYPGTVIIMSAYGTIPIAIEAIKLGAYDYIAKPFNADEILLTMRKAVERDQLRTENKFLKQQISKTLSFNEIIAKSASMERIFETINKIADYKTTVLIYGESGTGKELIARAIHYNSSRKNRKFVAINCAAIPENLLESELFGHKRGAFTDATKDKKGLFEEADGGTIFLDEIGELPLHLQVKLLRVLQENEIRPVGDNRSIPVDVRVLAATLRDLEEDVKQNRFRDDLFYRLNVIALMLPPLRERREDIPLLVEHFVKKHGERLQVPVDSISKEAMSTLLEYEWKGNVRELENCIERAMILCEGKTIEPENLPAHINKASVGSPSPLNISDDELSIKTHMRITEEHLIRKALTKTGGNRTHAAKLLEISHRTLLYKLKEYELVEEEGKDETDKDSEPVEP